MEQKPYNTLLAGTLSVTVLTDEVREKTKEDKIAVMIPFPPSQQSRYYYRFVHRGGGQGGGNPPDRFENLEVDYVPLSTVITTLNSGIICCGIAFHIDWARTGLLVPGRVCLNARNVANLS